MKALVYEDSRTLAVRDVPEPEVAPGDVLVRIEAVGICGSDMHAYLGHDERRPAPLILGHEPAGVIVGGPRDGERVTINPLVTNPASPASRAGRENLCPDRQIISMPPREGAFAQFVALPERNVVSVPDGIELSKAAMAEPLAVGWHATKLALRVVHPAADRRALVIGGGAIGLALALSLRAMKWDDVTIVEPNPARRERLAEECGQKAVESASGSYPLIADAVGYRVTRETAVRHVEPGGVIVHVGLGDANDGLDIRRMTLQEITVFGTYAYTAEDFRETALAIFDGRLGSLDWYEPRPLSGGPAAFDDLLSGKVAAPKIILRPWD